MVLRIVLWEEGGTPVPRRGPCLGCRGDGAAACRESQPGGISYENRGSGVPPFFLLRRGRLRDGTT